MRILLPVDLARAENQPRTKAYAERFFGGFKEATKTEVLEIDRKEIYNVNISLALF